MSDQGKLEKRPSRGNLRLSRKQKTERVRRERINTSLDKLKILVCKEEEKQDKIDKADILEATVSYVRTARVREYQQNPNFRSGYNQCVTEFVQFLVSLDNVKPEDKAKLLAGMSSVLCGVKKPDENTVLSGSPSPRQPQLQRNDAQSNQNNGKIPIPRQPLQTINLNMLTPSESQLPTSLSNVSTSKPASSLIRDCLSTTSNSVFSNNVSVAVGQMIPKEVIEPSLEKMIDSVFCDDGLETSLAKAVSAGINLELADLSSIDSGAEEVEEMDSLSLPSMFTFLEDLSNQ